MAKYVYLLTLDNDKKLSEDQMMDIASNLDQIVNIFGDVELEYLGERNIEGEEDD